MICDALHSAVPTRNPRKWRPLHSSQPPREPRGLEVIRTGPALRRASQELTKGTTNAQFAAPEGA
eukprot:192463-Pyramimonas_sp.AAC.1